MELLSLNEDVLAAIASFLDAVDARSLSLTSQRVHIIGKQQALSASYLYFANSSSPKLRRFCEYVLADAPNLIHCVRSIYINTFYSECPGDDLRLLADVLHGAIRLKRLSIDYFGTLVHYEPRLIAAVSSLPSLEKLELDNAPPDVGALLARLRSTPRCLRLSPLRINPKALLLPAALRYTLSLQNVQTLHLDNLSTEHIMVRRTADASGERFHYVGPLWPSVRHLELFECAIPVPIFLDAFPSLETLNWVDANVVDTQQRVAWRKFNLRDVTVDDIDGGFRLKCGETALLDVDCCDSHSSFHPQGDVQGLIICMTPVLVKLRLSYIDQFDSVRYLIPHIPNAKLLEVTMECERLDVDEVARVYTRTYQRAIEALRTSQLFCIMMDAYTKTSLDYWDQFFFNDDELPPEEVHIEEDFQNVSSIRYLAIGKRDQGYTWYRIRRSGRDGEGAVFEELSKEVGERLREYLWSTDVDTLRSIHDTDVPSSLFE